MQELKLVHILSSVVSPRNCAEVLLHHSSSPRANCDQPPEIYGIVTSTNKKNTPFSRLQLILIPKTTYALTEVNLDATVINQHVIHLLVSLLACFLQNESHFAGLIGGDETQLIAKFVGETTDLFSKVVAHNSLPDSVATVAAMLRTLRSRMRELDGSAGPAVQIPNSHGNLGIGIGIFARPNFQIPVQIPKFQRLVLGCIEASKQASTFGPLLQVNTRWN